MSLWSWVCGPPFFGHPVYAYLMPFRRYSMTENKVWIHTHTHTHPFHGPFPGLPRWAGTRKVKPIWIFLKQETVSGSGISWAICNSALRSRQITMPAPHHWVFYRPDALPAAQPTASKHWRHRVWIQSTENFLPQECPWRDRKNNFRSFIYRSSTIPANFVKGCLVDVQIIGLKEITKNIFLNTSEACSQPSASLKPGGLNKIK